LSSEKRIIGKARLEDPLRIAAMKRWKEHSPKFQPPVNPNPIPEYARAYIHRKIKGSERKAVK
jgi:hypothetical protein